jgi:hypothetical protein
MKSLFLAVVFAVLAVLLGFSRWLARRHWAAAGNLLVAVLLFGVAYSPSGQPLAHLATYQPMPHAKRRSRRCTASERPRNHIALR